MFNAIPKVSTKNLSRDILKNAIDEIKLEFKQCSSNLQKSRRKQTDKIKTENKQKTKNKIVELSTNIPLITLTVNALNIQNKRQAEWLTNMTHIHAV